MNPIRTYIEHTNLQPTITGADVEQLLAEANTHQFCGICVPPYWAKKVRYDLGNSPIRLVTVIGFPLGYNRSEVKMQELKSALREGVDEFDVVVNISAVKHNAFEWIKPEIFQFAQVLHEQEKILKVILETAYLTEEEIKRTAQVCADAGADYIKTSTGFAPEGAKVEHIKLLRALLPETVGIKASGGIRDYATAKAMIEAGADRIGTSAGVRIVGEDI
jgi:deoxyribose-phosphate aldolase